MSDFNEWNAGRNFCDKPELGVFTIKIPFVNNECPIKNGQVYKLFVKSKSDEEMFRCPQHCIYEKLNEKL